MGFFDAFLKTEEDKRPKPARDERSYGAAAAEAQSASVSPNAIPLPTPVKPKSFKDVYDLLDMLKLGQAVAVDCSELKESTAIRVLDILSGAAYALNGGWRTYGNEVFLFALGNTFSI